MWYAGLGVYIYSSHTKLPAITQLTLQNLEVRKLPPGLSASQQSETLPQQTLGPVHLPGVQGAPGDNGDDSI